MSLPPRLAVLLDAFQSVPGEWRALVALSASMVALVSVSGVPRGVAFAVAVASAWVIARHFRDDPQWAPSRAWLATPRAACGVTFTPGNALADVVALGAIFAVTQRVVGALLWDHEMPVSHDHTTHAYKAWIMATQLLPRGRVQGWTHWFLSGDPVGELYPFMGELYVALVYKLALGKLTFAQAYGFSIGLLWVALGACIYLGGRHFVGRLGAACAAVFYVSDLGAWDSGPWDWAIVWGVWPQFLALSFGIVALGRLHVLLARPAPWRFAAFAVPLALALLSHPIASVYLAPAVVLYPILRALHEAKPVGRMLVIAGAGGALAWGLVAFWQIPFAALAPTWAARYAMSGGRALDAGHNLVLAAHFNHSHAVPVVLGLVGAAVALRRRAPGPLLFALHGLGLMYLSTHEALLGLRLLDASEAFGRMQFSRVYGVSKLSWMLAAGHAVQVLAAASAPARKSASTDNVSTDNASIDNASTDNASTDNAPSAWRPTVAVFLAALAVAPFLPGARNGLLAHRNTLDLHDEAGVPDAQHWQEYLEWSRVELYERDFVRNGFFRVFYAEFGNQHEHLYYHAGIYNHLPVFKYGVSVASTFYNRVVDVSEAVAQAMNVKYVVSTYDHPFPNLELVRSFGIYNVYRYTRFNPHRVIVPGAAVHVTRFDNDEIRFTVRNAPPGARARIAAAYYPRWRGTMNGAPVALGETLVVASAAATFIEMPVRDGEAVLRYEPLGFHTASRAVSLAALLVALGLVVVSARPALRARLASRLAPAWARAAPWASRCAVAAVCAAPVLLYLRAHPPTGRGALYDFRRARAASVSYLVGATRTECRWSDGTLPTTAAHDAALHTDPYWDCAPVTDNRGAYREVVCAPQLTERATDSIAALSNQVLIDALYIPAPGGSRSEARYERVPMGATLRGVVNLGMAHPMRRDTAGEQALEVLVDNVSIGRVQAATEPVRFALDTSRWRGTTATVVFRWTARYAVDLCLQAATYR